ncbi:hypothetical protein JI435_306970, partial [Parastagonospora nodorum SN15]
AHHQHALTPLARRPSRHLAASTTPGHDRIPPLQPPRWPAHRRLLALEFQKRSTTAHLAEASIVAVTNVLTLKKDPLNVIAYYYDDCLNS